jgi:hypothetical protein
VDVCARDGATASRAAQQRRPLTIVGRSSPAGRACMSWSRSKQSMTHDQAHAYCRRLAQQLAATDPDRYTTNGAFIKRPGRLFIDYLRNGRGTTVIGTYSPRPVRDFRLQHLSHGASWSGHQAQCGPHELGGTHLNHHRPDFMTCRREDAPVA